MTYHIYIPAIDERELFIWSCLDSVENDQADAGRDGRTYLTRPYIFSGVITGYYERGHGKIHFSVQLTTSRIGNHTRLIHLL